jgi:CelD/BcsL family acetyltransferase involved in cellulose biosynthesis
MNRAHEHHARAAGQSPAGALRIQPLASMGACRSEWAALARESANIFSTWEWADIWWRHFGSEGALALASAHDAEGRRVAMLPLHIEHRHGLSVARLLGHGVADQLGPVCHPSHAEDASQALNDASVAQDILLADRLPGDMNWDQLGGSVIHTEQSPVIALAKEGGWDQYLDARSANFRQQVRRRARHLRRGFEVSYRLCQDPARLSADIDTLLALHAAHWGSRSDAFTGLREPFHREFAAVALKRGWLRLWLAESLGEPVAAWYGFRFAGVESFYQSGRDPAWDRFAVGAGLLEHSIHEAFSDGMREYRLLRGDELYKRRYATSLGSVQTVAVPHDTLGRGVVATVDMLGRRRNGRRLVAILAGEL